MEVFNWVLEQYLYSFVHSNPYLWSKYLTFVEWSYNTFTHSSTAYLPFHIIYGNPASPIPYYLLGSSYVEVVDTLLASRQTLWSIMLIPTPWYVLGCRWFGYVRLRPYQQQSLFGSTYHKHSKRFYWPYKILAQIGIISYQLDLPLESKIHPVFHCSLLKHHQGPSPDTAPLPSEAFNHQPLICP